MLLQVPLRPAQIPEAEAVAGLRWDWLEVHHGQVLVAVAGQAVQGGECLQIIKPLCITPSHLKRFKALDMPALTQRARRLGARRIVSTARPDQSGFIKLTKAVGYDDHVVVAVINLED